MWSEIIKHFKTALIFLILLTVLTGLIYPFLVTALAQIIFPFQANGSLIHRQGEIIGSELIGQSFSDAKYFWSRPSATTPFPYNAAASSGSNLGPTNPALFDSIKKRIDALHQVDTNNSLAVPVDLITASASGLDPHISPAAAYYQVPRVAQARHLPAETIQQLVDKNIENRQWGFLGEARVNVLKLNLALDALHD